jgi:hypothetical protein
MIITKEILIKINPKNIYHLKSLGYTGMTFHKDMLIPVEHLSIGSGYKLNIICDVCGEKVIRRYCDYMGSYNNGGYFACSNKCSYKKKQKTFMEHYGVKHLLQSKELRDRMKTNNLEKYGVEYISQTKEVKEKRIKTCLDKYGVENPSQLEEFKIKKENTSLINNGVKYHNQNKKDFDYVFRKINKIKTYDEKLYYQSSYEKHFLDYCKNKGILNDIHNFEYRFKYLHNNVEKFYFPDFYIKKLNLIIEIKSKYYYDKYLETNDLKREKCISDGYQYIFIIDKNYEEFDKILYQPSYP